MIFLILLLNRILAYCFCFSVLASFGQMSLDIRVNLDGQRILPDHVMDFENTQVNFKKVKIYLSNFEFYRGDSLIATDKNNAYLIDLESDSTRHLLLDIPDLKVIDRIRFLFGIDSTASTSGAMEKALDPMHGMYWSWQSGYINCKIEGIFTDAKKDFQLHLGGYMAPFLAAQECSLLRKGISEYSDIPVEIDLAPLMRQIRQENGSVHVMSPGANAVAHSKLIAHNIFLTP